MPEMSLIRIGRALLPADEDSEVRMLKIPERVAHKSKVTVPRLSKTHSTFFGVLSDICEHWPENAEFDPEGDPEFLRAYLLCRVGHRESVTAPWPDDPKAQQRLMEFIDAAMTRLRAKKEYPFLRHLVAGGEPCIALHFAKSISHEVMDETEFRPVADRVYAEIYALTGIDVSDLILEHKTRRPVAA